MLQTVTSLLAKPFTIVASAVVVVVAGAFEKNLSILGLVGMKKSVLQTLKPCNICNNYFLKSIKVNVVKDYRLLQGFKNAQSCNILLQFCYKL